MVKLGANLKVKNMEYLINESQTMLLIDYLFSKILRLILNNVSLNNRIKDIKKKI